MESYMLKHCIAVFVPKYFHGFREILVQFNKAVYCKKNCASMAITYLTSFLVESVYSITGRGTVVTGRVTHGAIKTGQEVELLGFGKSAKAKVTGRLNV